MFFKLKKLNWKKKIKHQKYMYVNYSNEMGNLNYRYETKKISVAGTVRH